MALELNGTTGVSLVQDGVVTAADLASTLDLSSKTITLPSTHFAQWQFTNNLALSGNSPQLTDLTINGINGLTHSSGNFTVTQAGVYLVTFSAVALQSSASERQFGAMIYVNSTSKAKSRDQVIYVDGDTSYGGTTVTWVGVLNVNDVVKFYIERSYSDGNITVGAENTNGCIALLGSKP